MDIFHESSGALSNRVVFLMSLTTNAIANYQNGISQNNVIVKVLSIRTFESTASSSTDSERYRLAITDGTQTLDACVLTQNLNHLVKDKRLKENSIVKLNTVVHNKTNTGKSFLSILDLSVMSTNTNILPIGMITSYQQGLWKIRARCFAKSPIRPHPVCNFDFVDDSGEIRLTAFRDECHRFHPLIEVDKVYDIMGVRVKPADKRYNNLRHDYELTLVGGSTVRLVDDDECQGQLPDVHFDFVPLRDVSKHADKTFIDVIGIVDTCTDLIAFTNRTSNRDAKRREITLIDEDTSISMTLWDEQAENFDEELAENKVVVAFQRSRVAIYNNKYSLSGHSNMLMRVNPNLIKAKHLRIWYDAGGRVSTTSPVRSAYEVQWKTIGQIASEKLGQNNRPDYVLIKALCMHISNDRVVYMACPNNDCTKKVNRLSSGLYQCENCQRDYKEFQWRFMFRAELTDSTGAVWVSFFHQQARDLMGDVTAEQFAEAKENNDEILMQRYLNQNTFKEKIFRLRVNEESYNDVTMVKITCVSVDDLDFRVYGQYLLSMLSK